jgi:hypothetical protein
MSLPIIPYQRHQNQAKHNEQLLKESAFPNPCGLVPVNYKDWNITILFYTALHHVQAYLEKNSSIRGYQTTFQNHRERNNYLARLSVTDMRIAQIVDDYVGLCNASFLARYTPCRYWYIPQNELCNYTTFALKDVPRILNV